MNKLLKPILLAFLVPAQTALCETVLISQPTYTSLSDFAPSGFGQSFTAGQNFSANAIDLYVSSSFGGSDFTVRIFTFNTSNSTLGPTVLALGSHLEEDLSTSGAWARIELDKSLQFLSGQSYAFTVVASDPGGTATGWNNYGRNSANVYPGGSYFGLIGGAVFPQSNDLAFQVVSVPEPKVCLLLGFALLAFLRHTLPSNPRAHSSAG